jgi:adenylate kinase family enzyme
MVQKEQKRRRIVICVAGLSGCGKSTAARRLAKKYGLSRVRGDGGKPRRGGIFFSRELEITTLIEGWTKS